VREHAILDTDAVFLQILLLIPQAVNAYKRILPQSNAAFDVPQKW